MRMLIAIVLGCALAIGVSQAASSGATERAAPSAAELTSPAIELTSPATELTSPATDLTFSADSAEELQLEGESNYECKYSPYCRSASQCTAYCAGGAAVCFQGCCSCAS